MVTLADARNASAKPRQHGRRPAGAAVGCGICGADACTHTSNAAGKWGSFSMLQLYALWELHALQRCGETCCSLRAQNNSSAGPRQACPCPAVLRSGILLHKHATVPYLGDPACLHLLTVCCAQGYTVAIRMLLRDDSSASMTLFFGCVGALNAACLAPVLLGLQLAGLVDVLGMSARVLLLTVTKGAAARAAELRMHWRCRPCVIS